MSFIHHISLKLSSRKKSTHIYLKSTHIISLAYILRGVIYIRIDFNSILYSLKTPDHWYMRFNIIIFKLHLLTGEGHKKEAKYNKCKIRKNKYKMHANVVKKNSQEEHILFRIFLISLESDFRVLILPEFISLFKLNVFFKIY